MAHRLAVPSAVAALLLTASFPAGAARVLDLETAPPPQLERPAELHPYAGYQESYDSNIFLLPQAVSSWIHTPSVGLRAPLRLLDKNLFQLTYDLADRIYSNAPGLGSGVVQQLDGRYWYKSPRGLYLRAMEDYLNTIDPATTELTGLSRRWQNTAGGEVSYLPDDGRLFLAADVTDLRHKYVSDPTVGQELNRYDATFGGKIGWQLQPKTVAYAAYHRQLIHFTDHPTVDRDSRGDLVDFGVQGALAPKISGTAQAGFVERGYDSAAAAGQSRVTRNMTAMLNLAYEPERSRVDLTFSRFLQESSYDVNQFYIATGGVLSLTHSFPWRLYARVYGGAEFDKYPTAAQVGPALLNRRDDNYQSGLELQYPIGDYVRVGGSYLYRARFSKDASAQFNFRDQITSVSATVTF